MSNNLTEEEKGKTRVIAIMCGGIIPAWAMSDKQQEDETEDNGND